MIEAKNRGVAGTSAPAHALFLVDVGYDFKNYEQKPTTSNIIQRLFFS